MNGLVDCEADAEESEHAREIASAGSGRLTVEWLEVVPVAGRCTDQRWKSRDGG